MARVGHALTRRPPPGLDTSAGEQTSTDRHLSKAGASYTNQTIDIIYLPDRTIQAHSLPHIQLSTSHISSLVHQYRASQPYPIPQTDQFQQCRPSCSVARPPPLLALPAPSAPPLPDPSLASPSLATSPIPPRFKLLAAVARSSSMLSPATLDPRTTARPAGSVLPASPRVPERTSC